MPKRYDPFAEKDGQARPTKLRLLRSGRFELHETDIAGVRVARDMQSHFLDKLYEAGVLSIDQRDAGVDYASLYRQCRLVTQGRSCLDIEPVGHEEEPDDSAEHRMRDLRRELGPLRDLSVYQVAVEERLLPSMDRARDGLDVCARFFRG